MKLFIIIGLVSTIAYGQSSPSATPGSFYSPSASAGNIDPATGGVISPTPQGTTNIDQVNTAPTSVPTDTTLLNTPSNNPNQQSQEDFNSFPDTTVSPGSSSGGGSTIPGTGTNNSFPTP